MKCPRCQQENPPHAKFCLECATVFVGADPSTHLTPTEKTNDLRRSLKEALDQQAATGEILRVISTSPTDLQPVFDVIVDCACRLCDGVFAVVFRFDGDLMHFMAQHGFNAEGLEFMRRNFPASLTRESMAGRALLDRCVVQYEDVTSGSGAPPASQRLSMLLGFRAIISVPILRNGIPVGALTMARREPGLFSDRHVDVLRTFADQAVIAIENVRLFTELQQKNRALTQAHSQLTETLEQQTATSEVLRAINRGHTESQPVFDVIAASALRLCRAVFSAMVLYDGKILRLVAVQNAQPEGAEALWKTFPRPVDEGSATGRAIRSREVVSIPDVFEDPHFTYGSVARVAKYRSVLAVPMMRDGEPIGVILVTRPEPGPFSGKETELLKTFADQAVITIENVRLFKELEARNRELTATSQILQVIASSPTEVQPVFDAIARNAAQVCGGTHGAVHLLTDEWREDVARYNYPSNAPSRRVHVSEIPNATRVIREGTVFHISDVESDPRVTPAALQRLRVIGTRAYLGVPMKRGATSIGSISVGRHEPGAFSEQHIELLKTFADQAVIAIENVRLFNETKEALEQQTAMAEILRVISSSPTDYQPVFDTIVRTAGVVCGAIDAVLWTIDGDELVVRAHHGPLPAAMGARQPKHGSVAGYAVHEARVVHVEDLTEADDFPVGRDLARRLGWRTTLSAPLLREGVAIGAILIRRSEVHPFSDRQIALLQTFADQAVIAIENVRLFTELQEKNRALTQAHAQVSEALEQQTATSEILRVISSSPTDEKPVFDAIARSSVQLCAAAFAVVASFDGEMLHFVAGEHVGTDGRRTLAAVYPMRPDRGQLAGRAILDRTVIHVADVMLDAEYVGASLGNRATLSVPMLRTGVPIGTITIARFEPVPFTEQQITLLRTFADQAVIAIENVRLFKELQTSNRELRTALDTQTATGDILSVISRSQTDVQPVFDAIVASALRLLRAYTGAVTRVEGDQIVLVALTSTDAAADAVVRAAFPQSLQSAEPHPLVARERTPLNIADAHTDARLADAARAFAHAREFRSWVLVPLLRQAEAVGAIGVTRREPGGFTDDEIALLQTFADQAVIAIENVRLFEELQARTGELTRSVGELRALGEVSQALSSTLDVEVVLNTIVTRANDLIGADGCTIFEYDGVTEQFHLRATRNLEPRLVEVARGTPLRKGDQGILGQLPMGRHAVQVPDITAGSYSSPISDVLIEAGYRAVIAVPLIREDHLIGALTMNRKTPGEFPAETIELLQTFATQSALAIQNARLFREIEIKSRELEVASQHKSEFLANMSHELRTPLNAIIGFSEVLGERMFGELNEKQDEYLKDIHASGQHLLSLINDILDLSKIEAGKMELEVTDFDLPMTIDNALMLVRERAARRGIELQRSVDERLGQIQADERKIRQVLLNLLSNAIKFTPEGGRIAVGAKPMDGSVEIFVSDTGVGIAPEDQEAVFEEFRQVGTADKKVEGTGLGLALSRKFIELHGGKIWVKSRVGEGSTFTFTVPVRRGE